MALLPLACFPLVRNTSSTGGLPGSNLRLGAALYKCRPTTGHRQWKTNESCIVVPFVAFSFWEDCERREIRVVGAKTGEDWECGKPAFRPGSTTGATVRCFPDLQNPRPRNTRATIPSFCMAHGAASMWPRCFIIMRTKHSSLRIAPRTDKSCRNKPHFFL